MINPKELRIDNWVNWRNSFYQVENGFVLDEYTEEYTPISLTPEILEKAGFKRHKCGISGADMWQGMDAWSNNNPYFSGWLFRGNGKELKLVGYFNSSVRYLHQLQNLYFALTGEELNIEL